MKFLVVGYGSIGARHGRNLSALGHKVHFLDPHKGSDMDFGVFHGELKECVDATHADGVIIASPTKTHVQYMMEVIKADKHVLVEKPIGFDCPPFIKGFLFATRERNPGLVVATGFNLRMHACVQEAKALIQDGIIGSITSATFRVQQKSTKPAYLDDGVLRNWMSHEIDAALYLVGHMELQKAEVDMKDGNDFAAKLHLQTANGAPVVVIGDYFTDPEVRTYDIYGTGGVMHVDLVRRTIKIRNGLHTIYDYQAEDSFDANYVEEMRQFVEACRTGQMGDLATGEDGVRCLEIIMQAREMAGI